MADNAFPRTQVEDGHKPDPVKMPPEGTPAARQPYEPPRLTCLGNLRNLVGKTGVTEDLEQPDEPRPP